MIRKAFVMQLRSGQREEYRRRHDPIWDDLKDAFESAGVTSYSIFLHPQTLQLFAYAEVVSEELWNAIAETEVCRRWWESMRGLMETNPDASPAAVSLDEVFHFSAEIPF